LNVCPIGGCKACPEAVEGIGYNNCYNDIALEATNLHRGHSQSPALTLDTDAATRAQTWAEELDGQGSIATSTVGTGPNDRPANCAEILFQQTAANKVDTLATSDDAVAAWYAGNTEYDAEAGAPKAPTDPAKKLLSDNYTKLVWESSTVAGFGIKGSIVVAWICEKPGNEPYTPEEFKKNVKGNCFVESEEDGDEYNECFNTVSLAATNERRKWHEADELTLDKIASAAL